MKKKRRKKKLFYSYTQKRVYLQIVKNLMSFKTNRPLEHIVSLKQWLAVFKSEPPLDRQGLCQVAVLQYCSPKA